MSASNNNTASGRLIQAAKSGNVSDMMAALRAGAEKEALDPEGNNCTALHWSARKGHKNVLIKLLSAGVNVDARTDNGSSALHLCCHRGHEVVALMLMAGGAIIDATNYGGITPLMVASGNGHANVVVCLLDEAGAEAGHKDNDGRTSMHYACIGGHNSVLNILAQHGADLKIKDNDGCQPIHGAASNSHDLIVSTLIQLGADVNCTDNQGNTPLYYASELGYVDVVESLLRNGAHTNITTPSCQATHIAVWKGHLNVFKKLIEYGSDINATLEDDQSTLLHLAVQNNHKDIGEWLILKGADPYTCNAVGDSAIQLALNEGNREMVSFMASRNLHLPSARGSTPSTSEEATSHQCAVCLNQRTTTIMTEPCHHAKTCKDCMDTMEANGNNHCPICRATITKRILIYQ